MKLEENRMHRRKFITSSLTGLPVLFLAPALILSACGGNSMSQSNGKTIIVVGAGISGLAAAKKLKEQGFNVIILEAQDKVGGRLRSDRTLGVAFDEGASWIHGVTNNPLTALAKQAGMQSVFADDESIISYDIHGVPRDAASYDNAETQLDAIIDSMMQHGSANQSFETVFNTLYPDKSNDRLWQFLLSAYVTFDTGDLDKLSSTLYNEGEEFGGGEHIVTNGYDTLPHYLANGLNIQLNQRVSKIDYTNAKIKITHNETQSEADYVIVTVPLGVLKANSIEFVPRLPTDKQNAIEKVGMNCVNKFLLTWESAFWDDELYISYTPKTKDKFNYFVNVKKFHPTLNALMTFAYADYARQTETMTDAQVINEIMLHLKDMYGNNIPNPTNMIRTQWQSNENSFGAYSYTAAGTQMHHFDDLAKAVNNKLFVTTHPPLPQKP